ncbi:MAG: hypothetical protein ACREWI_06640, partial [Telluria sp.]
MKTVRHLCAAAVLSAVSFTAAAGPIAVDEFIFNNNVTDTGSKPLTMTKVGTLTYSNTAPAAAEGMAVNFNGSSYVRAAGPVTNNVGGDFSLSFWMKTGSNSRTGSAWYQGNGLVDAERGGVTSDWGVSLLNNRIAFGMGGWDTTL